MKRKKLLRSVLACLCCTTLVLGNFSGLATVSAEDTTSTLTPPTFEEVTFSDFGMEDGTYGDVADLVAEKTYTDGLANKTFVGKFNFSATSRLSINFGGKGSGWQGVALGTWTDGRLWFWEQEGKFDHMTISADATAGVIDKEQVIKLSFEVTDTDNDNEEDDVRFWLYFGNTLYNNGPLYEAVDYAQYLGNYLGIRSYNTGTSVTIQSVEDPQESLPTNFEQVTPMDFGLIYDTYEGATESANNGESGSSKTPVSSMDKVLFETKITLGTNARFIYMRSNDNAWAGMTFLMHGDKIWLQNNFNDSEGVVLDEGKILVDGAATTQCYLQPDIAIEGATSLVDLPFHFAITTEFTDYDGDGTVNDLKLGVWFNYKLYNEQYFYIRDCIDIAKQGIYLYRPSGSIILESPIVVEKGETNESYNLSDGPYLVVGSGTITVNGTEVENGTTLTTPGEYQIVSGNGQFTRNVTLYDAGSKSSTITYEENVMPIVGYYGPTSGTDSRGNKYNLISEDTYSLLSEAGFNLINKFEKNWATSSHRTDIIQSLTYAQKYNMGLYIWDSRLQASGLTDEIVADNLAAYSQYESFKGIHVVDEPATTSYYPTWDSQLDDYTEQATAINQYCNLNAYINLFPYMNESKYGSYSGYVDEYLEKTDAKFISYDYYVYGKSYSAAAEMIVEQGNVADYFTNLSIVREKALANEIPFWPYIQVGNNWNIGSNETGMTTTNDSPTREELLWNVNTSLAYGAKGIQYFPMVQPNYFAYEPNNGYDYERNGVLGANGEPTQWYPYVKEANEKIALVDEYLLEADSKAVLAKGTNAQTDTNITEEAYGAVKSIEVSDTENGVVVGAFDYKGDDMFYVVNYDTTQSESVTLRFTESKDYCLVQDGTEVYYEGNSCGFSIPAGEAVLVIINDYMPTYSNMNCLTPEDFGMDYKTYAKLDTSVGEYGETNGTCMKIDSMDNVMFKTKIKLESGAQLRYMQANNNHWTGITFRASGDTLYFDNALTETAFYVGDAEKGAYSYVINPAIALGDDNAVSLVNQMFDLTLTTQFVDYDSNGGADDLQLGIYINDCLYNDTYFYIPNCKDICQPSLFLYRPSGSLELASSVVFGTSMQPEISDSIAMTYAVALDMSVTETPYMTFEMNGNVLADVQGTLLEPRGSVWEFTYPEVMAQDMANTVTATLSVGEYTKQYQTSMLEYCTYILNSEEQSDSLKNLLVDLVQYGESVQRYRGVSADSDELLTKKLETLVPDYAQYDLTDETSLENLTVVDTLLTLEDGVTDTETYTWKNVGLVLGNKAKLRYQFAANDITNLKVEATIDKEEYELTIKETATEGIYAVDFEEIYAYEYATPIVVRFYEVSETKEMQVGKTVHYSVNTYLYAMKDYIGKQASLLNNLLLAIHNYGTAAEVYQNTK